MQPLYSQRQEGGWNVHDQYSGARIGYVHRHPKNTRKWAAFRRSHGSWVLIGADFDSRREATQEVTNP